MGFSKSIAGVLLALTAGTPAIFAASFTFDDFSSAPGLNLVGDAALTANRLRLTSAVENQVGAAWLNQQVSVQGGFVTSFQFQMTNRGGYTPDWEPGVVNDGADGLTFTIQNSSPTAMGLYASGIGYYGIPNSLSVEFDTWNNKPSYCEPNGNHIAVQSLGLAGNQPEHCADAGGAFANPTLGIAIPSKDMSDGTVYDVMITYLPGALSIYFDNLSIPLLTVNVNLATLLNLKNGTDAFIGFTSSTGGAFENHDIVRWSYDDTAGPGRTGDDAGNIPEPATMFLTGGVLSALAMLRRR